ncbi:ABC transporter ATP-binding protein [Candidatus Sumerlaeota bacterium]|nr:ABC transporter ATP-binding protein [Candidatus Sumerlaeota bacterium]
MTPENNFVIKIENMTKVYQMGKTEVRALGGISFSIDRGGYWAIMGPSGSGKSTLLNQLGCLDRPTSGRYWLEGQDVSELNDNELSDVRLRRIGFIFQSFNLIQQLTVRENIEMPLYYLGYSPHESHLKASQFAEMVGLGERLDHRPMELSGGQQQRVAIARALVNDPAILLADEPTGNLDSKTGEQIMELLGELNRNGKTIIMVTHEPYIAEHARHQLHVLDGLIDRIEEKG